MHDLAMRKARRPCSNLRWETSPA